MRARGFEILRALEFNGVRKSYLIAYPEGGVQVCKYTAISLVNIKKYHFKKVEKKKC